MGEFNIKLNETLKKNILSGINPNYNNLEKAVYIYYKLCKNLQYSMDYLLEENKVKSYFTNVSNIEKIDGIKNKDVVCFTFNAIFLQLLKEANIYNPSIEDYNLIDSNNFNAYHKEVEFTIDGVRYIADATKGVFKDNDLIEVKFNKKINKFELKKPNNSGNKKLNDAIDKICTENTKFNRLIDEYCKLKAQDFKKYDLDERVKIFLKLCTNLGEYSIQSFGNIIKYKTLLFKDEELKGTDISKGIVNKKIDILFVKDINCFPSEYKCILFYNNKGYTSQLGKENIENLKIYEISIKNKSYKSITKTDFNNNINFGTYITCKNEWLNNKPTQYPMATIGNKFLSNKSF